MTETQTKHAFAVTEVNGTYGLWIDKWVAITLLALVVAADLAPAIAGAFGA